MEKARITCLKDAPMEKIVLTLIILLSIGCTTTHIASPEIITLNQTLVHHEWETLSEAKISEKMEFWLEQKKGSNFFMEQYRPEYFAEVKKVGIQYIRFGPNLLPASEKDFLIGDLDDFKSINKEDLATLVKILDDAYRNDIAIVLAMFELPGHRYGNPNEVETDTRLWEEEKYWLQSFHFWKELARAVKDHPAIVAYNPLNEPVTAYAYGFDEADRKFQRWLDKTEGTSADLNLFNTLMIEAIREVDSETPILLDGYFWTDPKGMPFLNAQEDPNVLYAFHNPAPWIFSSLEGNKGRYSYPDAMPKYWNGPAETWTIEDLDELLKPVEQFITDNDIENYRIIASEFWCNRRVSGCAEYFHDLVQIYNRNQWHWSFWAFNIYSTYTGFDYQLGDIPDSGRFVVNADKENIDLERFKNRVPNSVWNVISTQLSDGMTSNDIISDERIQNRDVHALISDLENEEWIIRDSAALAIASLKREGRDAIPQLVQLLKDEEWLVRRSAVYALSQIISNTDENVIKEIRKLQNDPENHVRIEVALALGKL